MIFKRTQFSLLILLLSFNLFADTLTTSNLKGQKYLFENGWFVITSPIEAWNFAQSNGEESRLAFRRALETARENASTLDFKENLADALKTMDDLNGAGSRSAKDISTTGKKVGRQNLDWANKNFKEAWKRINLGYLQYQKNNKDDLKALKEVNSKFFNRQNDDFQTLDEAARPLFESFIDTNEIEWKKHFTEGKYSFQNQYEKSGGRNNSLSGLWDILSGYGQFFYHSLFSPSAKVVTKGVRNSSYYLTKAVLYTFISSSNIVYSTGANLYYVSKLGYKMISPSVEAGFFGSLALINLASAPVTWGGLETAGVLTKVATTSVAPVVAGTQLTIAESADAAKKAAVYLFHGAKGVTQLGFETMESGVVLGYSALSQLPPQLLLSSMNAVIFLVYDGPRIVLMKATGKIAGEDVRNLPVGAVMDMKKLKDYNIDLVPITNDEFILKKVLHHVE